jgi:3D (Asp-Asp-Asp) domain-containing protein
VLAGCKVRLNEERTSADDRTVIPWETRVWWSCRRGTPQVVGGIRKEVRLGLVEER